MPALDGLKYFSTSASRGLPNPEGRRQPVWGSISGWGSECVQVEVALDRLRLISAGESDSFESSGGHFWELDAGEKGWKTGESDEGVGAPRGDWPSRIGANLPFPPSSTRPNLTRLNYAPLWLSLTDGGVLPERSVRVRLLASSPEPRPVVFTGFLPPSSRRCGLLLSSGRVSRPSRPPAPPALPLRRDSVFSCPSAFVNLVSRFRPHLPKNK